MTGQCPMGGAASNRFAPRLSRAAASILPGAMLVLLPKCPLCLAAWLTAVTGVAFPAAAAAWVRWIIVMLWVAAGALAAATMVRRREFGRVAATRPRPSVRQAHGRRGRELCGCERR
jgi:hypothetical protein